MKVQRVCVFGNLLRDLEQTFVGMPSRSLFIYSQGCIWFSSHSSEFVTMGYSMSCKVFTLWKCPTHYSSCFKWICLVALSQDCFTYRHNQVLHCLALKLSEFLSSLSTIHVYADLPGMRASESPQGTIPSLIITPYRPYLPFLPSVINSFDLSWFWTCYFKLLTSYHNSRGAPIH